MKKTIKAWAVVNWIGGLEVVGLTKVSMQGWVARYRNELPSEVKQQYLKQYTTIPVTITYTPKNPRK